MATRIRTYFVLTFAAVLLGLFAGVSAQVDDNELHVEQAKVFEVILLNGRYVTYLVHDVILRSGSGYIYCDSAIWARDEFINLKGHVIIDDQDYKLSADSVNYDLSGDRAVARGKKVELWSYSDSVYATGPHAFYNRGSKAFYMEQRPILYVNYPDTARMIEVIADRIDHVPAKNRAEALGDVLITSDEFSATAGCAVLKIDGNGLDLFDAPHATAGYSEVSGSMIAVSFEDEMIKRIDVVDSAQGELKEAIDSLETDYDRSTLKGKRLIFDFAAGVLYKIKCYGQAYSWYNPSPRGGSEFHQNTVSGDTITMTISDKSVTRLRVNGGAVGTYITGKIKPPEVDSSWSGKIDTVDYSSRYIEYDLLDSLITLERAATVNSGNVSLAAHEILFETDRKTIEAMSAEVSSEATDTLTTIERELQPNNVPVVLKDGADEIYSDYLEYSIDSEKGRLVQSKTDYDNGYYYGGKLFREEKEVFYVEDGRYTTCDAGEPHFHFYSPQMKMMPDDKLIARPVVFYIERLPIAILPYYVFPLKHGRHSGLLPFTFGKFQTGDRYVNDIGYYWAASEYWDIKTAFDYHEKNQTFTFRNSFNFNRRYVLNGSVTGDYARITDYSRNVADEVKRTRWVVRGNYNHTVTPSFNVRASGDFQSDKSYYSDYSQNLEQRLNRQTKSSLNFSKRFGASTSLSGAMSHTVNLDQESRSDLIPSLNLSLPTVWLFGSGGTQPKWYQGITFRYSPSLINQSNRTTVIDTIINFYDTSGSVIVGADTTKHRSRKEYAKITHNPALNLPTFKPFKYFIFTPRVSYSETWYKLFETDQSLAAGLDATTTYRTYSYNAGASLRTSLYGTVHPNIFGLVGFRQVLTPSVSYSWSPELNRHPEVRAFAGGGAGSNKSSVVSLNLGQLYQAKIQDGENVKNLDNLLSINTSASYNFESDIRPWSNLSTSFQSSILRNVSVDGQLIHTLYNPDDPTDETAGSPYLQSFSFNARFNLTGSKFIFDEAVQKKSEADSVPDNSYGGYAGDRPVLANAGSGTGWSMSASYSYNESGRDENFHKQAFLRFNLSFNLTPTTRVAYSQSYDIGAQATVNNSVNIVKKIHCWTGSLYWVPVGSNRGFGFKLFVTALPDIKLDNAHDTFLKTLGD